MPSSTFQYGSNLSSLYSAFQADDYLIDIVPFFDWNGRIPLLSCSRPIGPFKAGLATAVPLWLALLFHQRSLGSIVIPSWLTVENLSSIIDHERRDSSLWKCQDDRSMSSSSLSQSNQNDRLRLPRHYYEIAKRLTKVLQEPGVQQQDFQNVKAIPLLVQDLLELRVDKLRQQFQALILTSNPTETNLLVSVDGIGSQELAILQAFVTQALNDRHYLSKNGSDGSTSSMTKEDPSELAKARSPTTPASSASNRSVATVGREVEPTTEDVPPPAVRQRARVPIRQFRR